MTGDRDRAYIPRTARLSRSSPPSRDSSAHRLFHWNNALQRFFPGGDAVAHFVLIQTVESVFVQAEPGAIGVVSLHHVAPCFHWQSEARFFVPRDRSNLQAALRRGEENCPAELDADWNFSIRQSMEIFCCRYVEIKCTRHWKIDHRGSFEGWHD